MRLIDWITLPFRALWILAPLLGSYARYWLDPNFRDECDLEDALADEGEDGPTVARILRRMERRAARRSFLNRLTA